jgi:hypothetical protein
MPWSDQRRPVSGVGGRPARKAHPSSVSPEPSKASHPEEAPLHARILGLVRRRPVLSAASALLVLTVTTVLWVRAPAPPVSKDSEAAGRLSGRFGWQWCADDPAPDVAPSQTAPIQMGVVRTVQQGPLNIEWFWCRSKSRRDLVVLRAKVTNTSDEPIARVLLEFSLYDQDDAFLGSHSVAMQRLEAHGGTSVEDKLPTQYGEWTRWTAWSLKLANVNAN